MRRYKMNQSILSKILSKNYNKPSLNRNDMSEIPD